MSSKLWKLNSTLSTFCCVVSWPTLRAEPQLADIVGGKWFYVTTKDIFKNFEVIAQLRAWLRVVI